MQSLKVSARDFFLRRRDHAAARFSFRYLLTAQVSVEKTIAQAYFAFQNQNEQTNLFPDFIGIGAQKSATSWLDSVLRKHPDFTLPHGRKELHYFDSETRKGMQWYLWHFRNAGPDSIKGEITPAYSMLSLATIREIKAINPNLKIILLLRNPIERAWSMAVMDIIQRCDEPLTANDWNRVHAHLKSSASRARGNYSKILKRWWAEFGDDSVFVGFYEEIEKCPAQFIERLILFLGGRAGCFDYAGELLESKVRVGGKKIPKEIAVILAQLYHRELKELYHILPSPYVGGWIDSADRLLKN